MVDMNMTDFTQATYGLSTYAKFAVYNRLLLDTGAPKSICSEEWLHHASWSPVTKIPFPSSNRPLRFAGKQVKPLYVACIFCEVHEIHGKPFVFGQVAFVLPPTQI